MSRPIDRARVEADYFDGQANRRGDFNMFADRGWATLARCFAEMVAPGRPLRLLDVGCGTGESRRIYLDHCCLYVGLDLSHAMLVRAHRHHPGAIWLRADACLLPFASASFSVVAFSSVLHHLDDPRQALAEAYAVLEPGGHAFAFDPNAFNPAMALFRNPRSPLYLREGVSPNEAPLTPGALRDAFGAAGFAEVRNHGQSDVAYRSVAPRLLNACLGLYNIADRVLQRSGLGYWLGSFLVTVGRKPRS